MYPGARPLDLCAVHLCIARRQSQVYCDKLQFPFLTIASYPPSRVGDVSIGVSRCRSRPAGIGALDVFAGSFCRRHRHGAGYDGLVSGCAVGPDFLHPGAPEVSRYTKEPLALAPLPPMSQRATQITLLTEKIFLRSGGILYRSPPSTLWSRARSTPIPTCKSTLAALRIAKENTYAQQGKYFPLVSANFNPSRQQQAGHHCADADDELQPIQSLHRPARRHLHVRYMGPESAGGRIPAGDPRIRSGFKSRPPI